MVKHLTVLDRIIDTPAIPGEKIETTPAGWAHIRLSHVLGKREIVRVLYERLTLTDHTIWIQTREKLLNQNTKEKRLKLFTQKKLRAHFSLPPHAEAPPQLRCKQTPKPRKHLKLSILTNTHCNLTLKKMYKLRQNIGWPTVK